MNPFLHEEPGEFSDRQTVPHGNVMTGYKSVLHVDRQRAFHTFSIEGIDPVQNDERKLRLCSGFHAVEHGGDVGVEARANILNVEDQHLHPAQCFRGRLP